MSIWFSQDLAGWKIMPSATRRRKAGDSHAQKPDPLQHSQWEARTADGICIYVQEGSLFLFAQAGIPSGFIPLTVIERLRELEELSQT